MTIAKAREVLMDEIALTNNGKLLKERVVNLEAKAHIPALLKEGFLKRATFMYCGDSIRLG